MSETEVDFSKAPTWFRDTVEEIAMAKAPSWFREFFQTDEPDEAEEARTEQLEGLMQNKKTGDNDFVVQLGNVISSGESPRFGYDSWYGRGTSRGPAPPPKPPTQMTVREVLEWQKHNNPPGPGTNAIGRYQIVNIPNAPTMEEVVRELGFTGDELFDQTTQDKMFTHLLKRRGFDDFQKGKLRWQDFANNLAKEWASLPVVTPTRRGNISLQPGMSYYSGVGGNKAHVNVNKYKEVFNLADVQLAGVDDDKEES